MIGLLLLKHTTGLSDEDVVVAVTENPYMQAFCGFREFVTEEILDSSSSSKMRERLGMEFLKRLEKKTYKDLIERKVIKAKGMPNEIFPLFSRLLLKQVAFQSELQRERF